MGNLAIGVLAHVDAGKTTLSEALLYKTGQIKNLGRVDNGDAFLDTEKIEKDRGITVFSKQAVFPLGDKTFFLQDTPGHVDFSAEMERTLLILDYAILVISGPDGIQPHTELLLELLEKHGIPTFIFINKTDLPCRSIKLRDSWVDFNNFDPVDAALLSDEAMQEYEKTGSVSQLTLRKMISERRLIPVYRGSALRDTGIDELLGGLDKYTVSKDYSSDFGARCFKITRDGAARLSWLKITGGSLKLRDVVADEKITQIRIISGSKYTNVSVADAGSICMVCGLDSSYVGKGYGFEPDNTQTGLEPVLNYRVNILDGTDDILALKKLQILAEEDPLLKLSHSEETGEIQICLMGRIQTEVLTRVIEERFGLKVSIEEGRVVYKESIRSAVEGVGHFEPLRHYAEVHLLMEPLALGSGIVLETACSEDLLDRNWQRLILYNLSEYKHKGVLTGAPLTDVKITLIAGRSHLKHTEGGDFRQASLRAVRQGLMKAENVLLEPFYRFKIEIPSSCIGRAISDLKSFGAILDSPETEEDITVLTGLGPVSELSVYQTELLTYTKGSGRLSCMYAGYYPCHNAAQVIEKAGYDPDRDTDNPSSSVFCSHGSGVYVNWDNVENFMHIDSGLSLDSGVAVELEPKLRPGNFDFDDRELEEIMKREFGKPKRPKYSTVVYEPKSGYKQKVGSSKEDYYIIDGYNIIFSWNALKEIADTDLGAARECLIEILSEYKAVKGCEMVLVFDGYKQRGSDGSKDDVNGIHLVYTKEGQSADAYIESFASEVGGRYNVAVATSDGLVQLAALRSGVRRISAPELEYDVRSTKCKIDEILAKSTSGRSRLSDIARIKK